MMSDSWCIKGQSIATGVIRSAMDEDQAETEREEELIEQAYTYLTQKTYPDGCTATRKRVIRKKAAKFEVKDGELYYKQKQKGKVNSVTCLNSIL